MGIIAVWWLLFSLGIRVIMRAINKESPEDIGDISVGDAVFRSILEIPIFLFIIPIIGFSFLLLGSYIGTIAQKVLGGIEDKQSRLLDEKHEEDEE